MLHRGILFISLFLSACSIYRAGSGGYKTGSGEFNGAGEFKSPSDYSTGTDSQAFSEGEMHDARALHGHRDSYIPNGPFKMFWPVSNVHINRGFRPADDPHHEGLDLGGKRGMPILASHDGVVIYAGNGFSGYGNMVLIEFNHEWATLYGHLDGYAVKEGRIVAAGDPIGTMGASGHATGVHLHFELMHNRTPVDPLSLLSGGKQLAGELQQRKKRRPASYR
jgi:murein DD-endopeptidase MepM/ murein hydrolase activator NlpD